MSIGKRIRALRATTKMSGEQLGALFDTDRHPDAPGKAGGFSKQAVSHWENDRNELSVPQVAYLCEIFKTTADYLILGKVDGQLVGLSRDAIAVARKFDILPVDHQQVVANMIDGLAPKATAHLKKANGI